MALSLTAHKLRASTRGDVLDAAKGTVLWSRDFKKEFGIKTPTWGFAGHPLVDGKKVICLAGGEGSVVVAYDKEIGCVSLAAEKR